MNDACPNELHYPNFPYVLRAFSGSSSARELQNTTRDEQAQGELGWELTMDFELSPRIRHGFLNKTV